MHGLVHRRMVHGLVHRKMVHGSVHLEIRWLMFNGRAMNGRE